MSAVEELFFAVTLALMTVRAASADPAHGWRIVGTGATPIAGAWRWDETKKVYNARWANGAVAVLKVTRKDRDRRSRLPRPRSPLPAASR